MATVITGSDFDTKIASGVTLIDFYADWCGPCQAIAPVIDEIASEYDGKAGVYKVNVDDSQDLAEKFWVMSIPTLLVFKDGELVEKTMGASAKGDITGLIDKHI